MFYWNDFNILGIDWDIKRYFNQWYMYTAIQDFLITNTTTFEYTIKYPLGATNPMPLHEIYPMPSPYILTDLSPGLPTKQSLWSCLWSMLWSPPTQNSSKKECCSADTLVLYIVTFSFYWFPPPPPPLPPQHSKPRSNGVGRGQSVHYIGTLYLVAPCCKELWYNNILAICCKELWYNNILVIYKGTKSIPIPLLNKPNLYWIYWYFSWMLSLS